MTTGLLSSDGFAEGGSARRLSDRLRSVGSWLVTWLDTRADYWAAAAMYQQLSVLSDAELARRGLSRATLAHDCSPTNYAASDAELQRLELTRGGLAQDPTDAKRRWRRSIP
jgi:hypothetical protein